MRHLETPIQITPEDCLPWERILASRDLSSRFPTAGIRRVTVVRSPSFDRSADDSGSTRVWLALEHLQVSGSFKYRGALCALDRARRQGHSKVVVASAGNHGAGVARAANVLEMEAVVVVPMVTAQCKLTRITTTGATLVVEGGSYDQAEMAATNLAHAQGLPFISPYDNLDVIVGNGSSLAFELTEALDKTPEHVLVPIGGGGLASGLGWGLAAITGQGVRRPRRVWTAQSAQCPAFARSIERGQAVEQLEPAGHTLAHGLEGGISAAAFSRASEVVAGVTVVSEQEIASAMVALHDRTGLRVEGSAAAALVPALYGLPELLRGGDVVVVLTGRNIDDAEFQEVVLEGRVPATA
jgi:threonine dehydratase